MPASSGRRTPPRRPRSTVEDVSRRAWILDIALAVVVGIVGQLEAWFGVGSTHRQGPLWVQSMLYAITAALLVVRRVRPLSCLAGVVAVSVVEFSLVGSPEGFGVALAPLIAVYTVGRRLRWRRSWAGLALSVVLWVSWAFLDPMNATPADRVSSLVWLAPGVIAWLTGSLVQVSRLNAEQRRASREQQTAQAVAEERGRIARELHDVVGHSVSVMTVQTSAVRRRLSPDQEVERQALEVVEATGREALAEMRRMVGVLRESGTGPDLQPLPGIDQLRRLVETFRDAGLPVAVTVIGVPRQLSPGLDVTAYRLVQEGLTNSLRHACEPRHVEVVINYADTGISVSVRDDGQPPPDRRSGALEIGNGLTGMRERVTLFGGSLDVGWQPDGGFQLSARLPLELT